MEQQRNTAAAAAAVIGGGSSGGGGGFFADAVVPQQPEQEQPQQPLLQQQQQPQQLQPPHTLHLDSHALQPFGGYLANLTPSELRDLYSSELPVALTGAEFEARYGPHWDNVTAIDSATTYAIADPTAHPVHENYRVNVFRALLGATEALGDEAAVAGRQGGDDGGSSGGGAATSGIAATATADTVVPSTHATAGRKGGSSSSCSTLGVAEQSRLGASDQTRCSARQQGAGATHLLREREAQNASNDALAVSATGADAPPSSSHPVPTAATADCHDPSPPAALLGPLEALGELMLQSHASYSACGLGSGGTNRLVNIVRQHMLDARRSGRAPALYGAKITGGGCGGTVCVLGLAGAAGQAAVDDVAQQYAAETGYAPQVFSGSSVGAARFAHLRVRRR